jgi:hypothetical protein
MNVPLREGNFDTRLSEFFKDFEIKRTAYIAPRRYPDIDPYQQLKIDRSVAIFKKPDHRLLEFCNHRLFLGNLQQYLLNLPGIRILNGSF